MLQIEDGTEDEIPNLAMYFLMTHDKKCEPDQKDLDKAVLSHIRLCLETDPDARAEHEKVLLEYLSQLLNHYALRCYDYM